MARERRRSGSRGNGGRDGGDQNDLHEQIFEVLLDKVRDDPYPSTTHLDMIESILQDGDSEPYTDALLEKVRDDAFPSIDHLRRLMKFA
jgi:hypothetical protein